VGRSGMEYRKTRGRQGQGASWMSCLAVGWGREIDIGELCC
jgi:hypothetical protein